MQSLSRWAEYLKNSNPISDLDNLRESDKFCVLVYEQALARCPVLLLHCAEVKLLFRPGSASAASLQLALTFQVPTTDTSQ